MPIVAERDGHAFIGKAVEAGATVCLSSRDVFGDATTDVPGATVVRVADTALALADLGRAARTRLPDRVVGVTGSVGKTSTKDLLAGVLATTYPTAASEKSFNNELGLPMTLVNAPDGTEAVVLEMGARGVGHIELLCGIGRPTVGVITRVEAVHLEMFGSLEAVSQAKGELIEALPDDGLAVLNADEPVVAAMASRTSAPVLTYGLSPTADVYASNVSLDAQLRASFRLHTPWARPMSSSARAAHTRCPTPSPRPPRVAEWVFRSSRSRSACAPPRCRGCGWNCRPRRAASSSSTTPTTPTRRR